MAIAKSAIQGGDATPQCGARQVRAKAEQIVSQVADAVGNRNAAQAGALEESLGPDGLYAVGNRDAGQVGRAEKCIVRDEGGSSGDRKVGDGRLAEHHLEKVETGEVAVVVHISGHRRAGQVGAVQERAVSNIGDAGGNDDFVDGSICGKHICPDPGDGNPVHI